MLLAKHYVIFLNLIKNDLSLIGIEDALKTTPSSVTLRNLDLEETIINLHIMQKHA